MNGPADSAFAAIDLGSNSFHLLIARFDHGELRVIDRLKEMVRLGEGLGSDGQLDRQVMNRALGCLARFAERLGSLPERCVRTVATNTVRRLKHPQSFLLPAETALGRPIEVISGHEEARLVYEGVVHGLPPSAARRLVIDIGGGSTEFIIGQGLEPIERESLQLGCIAITRRHFADGKLSRRRYDQARIACAAELQLLRSRYSRGCYDEAIGSSGTNRAILALIQSLDPQARRISRDGLAQARKLVLQAGHVNALAAHPALSRERALNFTGGLAVLEAAVELFGIEELSVSDYALREGILYNLIGRMTENDPRERAVLAMSRRHSVDQGQAEKVRQLALALYDQVASDWQLDAENRLWLGWASLLHEVGLSISHHHNQIHGAYLVTHSDLAGFSTQEQALIAALIGNQRRLPEPMLYEALPSRLRATAQKLSVLLRLAVLLRRSRTDEPIPVHLRAVEQRLKLDFAAGWLRAHPLAKVDLETEAKLIRALGFELSYADSTPTTQRRLAEV